MSTTAIAHRALENYPSHMFGSKRREVLVDGVRTRLAAVIAGMVAGITSFVDLFLGTGSVSQAVKSLGITVIANDVLKMSATRGVALIRNNSTVIRRKEAEALVAGPPGDWRPFSTWYAPLLGRDNATFLDRLAVGLLHGVDEVTTSIAISAVVAVCERHRQTFQWTTNAARTAFCFGGGLEPYDVRTEWLAYLEDEFPILLVDNGQDNEVHNADAIEIIRSLNADALYLDPPYASTFPDYNHAYAIPEQWVQLLWGLKPTDPFKELRPIRHHRFGSVRGALDGFWMLLWNARHIPMWIISYNDSSKVKPACIRRIAEHMGRDVEVREFDFSRPTTTKDDIKRFNHEVLLVCRAKGVCS